MKISTISAVIPARERDWPAARRVANSLVGIDEVIIQGGNDGCGHAKNLGVEKSHGDILVFVDSDVRITGNFRRVFEPIHIHESYWAAEWYMTSVQEFYSQAGVAWTNLACHIHYPWTISPCMAVRRDAFERVGGFDMEETWEDIWLGLQLKFHGFHMGLLPVTCEVVRPFSFGLTKYHPASSRGKVLAPDGPFERLVF